MKYNENYITLYNITNICSGPPAKDMPKNGHDATHLPNLHIFVLLLAMIQMGSWFMKKNGGTLHIVIWLVVLPILKKYESQWEG